MMRDGEQTEVYVLVVGGGPVGMALAMELGTHGVPCLVVDERETVDLMSRKANGCNVRSFEHFRRWGIADDIRASAPLPEWYPDRVVYVTRLTGKVLIDFAGAKHAAGRSDLYAENYQRIPQAYVERGLRRGVSQQASVRTLLGWRVVGLNQDATSVSTEIENLQTGERETVQSSYVVGCDGAKSLLRKVLGIDLEGERALATNMSISFRSAELAQLHDKGDALHYWIVNEDVTGLLSRRDVVDAWEFLAHDIGEVAEGGEMRVAERLVAAAVGSPFSFTVTTADAWRPHAVQATRYRSGRILLAGDALHQHPPSGGFGMNQGIQDAVNLGWKLGGLCAGWAGELMLDSYERERRPANRRIIDEAVYNWESRPGKLLRPHLEDGSPAGEQARMDIRETIQKDKLRQFDSLGLTLGETYQDSPIIVRSANKPKPMDVTGYVPTVREGMRAPHRWLADGRSLFDAFGPEFTLVVHPERTAEARGLADAAAALRIPIAVLPCDEPQVRALYEQPFTLVRPDQYVAWQGEIVPQEVDDLLRVITGHGPRV